MASPEISTCVMCGIRLTDAGAEFVPCPQHAGAMGKLKTLTVAASSDGVRCPAGWHPIASAPWGRTVMVMGKSGYIPPRQWYQTLAWREPEWHQGGFNGMDSELADRRHGGAPVLA